MVRFSCNRRWKKLPEEATAEAELGGASEDLFSVSVLSAKLHKLEPCVSVSVSVLC